MRGVYSAGSLLGLHAMGASALFDDVYATSAGAINSAYFLSGSGHLGADTYYRVLSDGRFMSWRRPWKFVDIDFLIDEVLTKLRPIQIDRVLASTTRLWIAVADFDTGASKLLCAQSAGYPLLTLIKAAVAIPVVYNRLVPLGAFRAFDAGISNPYPLREAIADGCSHILVLRSRAESHVPTPYSIWGRVLFACCFSRGNEALDLTLRNKPRVKAELMALAAGRTTIPGCDPAIAAVSPLDEAIHDTTQDTELLRRAMVSCARGVVEHLGLGEEQLEAWFRSERI